MYNYNYCGIPFFLWLVCYIHHLSVWSANVIIIVTTLVVMIDVADFAEDSTQMTDYYGDFLSEETHM